MGLFTAPQHHSPAPNPNVLFLICRTSVRASLYCSSGGCANHWLVSMTPEAGLVANLLWQHKGHHSCAGFHAPSVPIITSSSQLSEETIASFRWRRGLRGLN